MNINFNSFQNMMNQAESMSQNMQYGYKPNMAFTSMLNAMMNQAEGMSQNIPYEYKPNMAFTPMSDTMMYPNRISAIPQPPYAYDPVTTFIPENVIPRPRVVFTSAVANQEPSLQKQISALKTFTNGPVIDNGEILYHGYDPLSDFPKNYPFDIPNDLTIELCEGVMDKEGNLTISGIKSRSLPDDLVVKGNLKLLRLANMKLLPNNLTVLGNVTIDNTPLITIPADISIGGDLLLSGTLIETLPYNLKIKGNLFICGSMLRKLPKGLKVDGNMSISYAFGVTEIPDDITIGGNLILINPNMKVKVPENINIGGEVVDLSEKEITRSFNIGDYMV